VDLLRQALEERETPKEKQPEDTSVTV
jgi:hypothetical protein